MQTLVDNTLIDQQYIDLLYKVARHKRYGFALGVDAEQDARLNVLVMAGYLAVKNPYYSLTLKGARFLRQQKVFALAVNFPNCGPYVIRNKQEFVDDLASGHLYETLDLLDEYAHGDIMFTVCAHHTTLWHLARLPEWEG